MKPILPQVGKVYECGLVPGVRVQVVSTLPVYYQEDFSESPDVNRLTNFMVTTKFIPEEGGAFDPNDEELCAEYEFVGDEWAHFGFTLADPDHYEHVESLSGNAVTLTDATRLRLEEIASALGATPQHVMERLLSEHLVLGRWLCTPEPEVPETDPPKIDPKLEAWLHEDQGKTTFTRENTASAERVYKTAQMALLKVFGEN